MSTPNSCRSDHLIATVNARRGKMPRPRRQSDDEVTAGRVDGARCPVYSSASGGAIGLQHGFFGVEQASIFKCRIERDIGRFKVVGFDCGARFTSAVLAIHAAVLPFNRQRSIVSDAIERSDNLFKVDTPAANRSKVPISFAISEIKMSAEHAGEARRG